MGRVGGVVEIVVVLLVLAAFVLVGVPLAVLLESALLRLVASGVGGVEVGWLAAVGTVLLGNVAQSLAMGCAGGADAGLCGTVVGFVTWSAMATLLTPLRFGQAVITGVVMAIAHWMIAAALVAALVVTGLGAAVLAAL